MDRVPTLLTRHEGEIQLILIGPHAERFKTSHWRNYFFNDPQVSALLRGYADPSKDEGSK